MSKSNEPPPLSLLFFNGLTILLFLLIPIISLRLLFIIGPLRPKPIPRKRPGKLLLTTSASPSTEDAPAAQNEPTRLLVVLGSGGHTAEMLAMLNKLDKRTFLESWTHRTYVVSEGDALSAERARDFENALLAAAETTSTTTTTTTTASDTKTKAGDSQQHQPEQPPAADISTGSYDIQLVPRARRIHQSLLTTPLSALRCLLACFSILAAPTALHPHSAPHRQHAAARYFFPDLILTNGPGTAVVVVLASLVLRFFDVGACNGRGRMRTVYVESWARVRRLSLSGRLLLRVVDRFVVQWEQLVERTGGRGEYLGVLV